MNELYDQGEVKHHTIVDKENNTTHRFRYANNVTLNLQDDAEQVNVLDYSLKLIKRVIRMSGVG